jgi:hypothetical protein
MPQTALSIIFSAESYGWSVIQALLSRSDRRLAPVIAAVRGKSDSQGSWKRAYKELKGDLPPWDDVVHSCWSSDRVLPWEHLEGPLPKSTLAKHQAEALTDGAKPLSAALPTESSPPH